MNSLISKIVLWTTVQASQVHFIRIRSRYDIQKKASHIAKYTAYPEKSPPCVT